MCMRPAEILFRVAEDAEGGYTASAAGHAIHTQGDTLEEVRHNIQEAVDAHFETPALPLSIRLLFVREESIAIPQPV